MRRAAFGALAMVVLAIGAAPGGRGPSRSPFVDPPRYARAPLVIRAELVGSRGGDRPWWFEVRVVAVLKNERARRYGPTLDVAVPTFVPNEPGTGLPRGRSTLYLVPYNATDDHPWKLLGGSAAEGVSHVAAPR